MMYLWPSQDVTVSSLKDMGYEEQWRPHGGGGKRGNLPPPQPPIGDPLRSMQIRGDFEVEKNGGIG